MILPKDDRLVLQAVTQGHFTVVAKLQTKFGAYNAETSVDVSPTNQPTKENLSGNWHIITGNSLGRMELIHRENDVSGVYSFARPNLGGSIAGFVDGVTFNADMVNRGDTRRKWLLRGVYTETEGYVEINGCMTRQVLVNNDWTQAGNPEVFYAASRARRVGGLANALAIMQQGRLNKCLALNEISP